MGKQLLATLGAPAAAIPVGIVVVVLAYDRYYDALGVTPDQLGLSHEDMVARADLFLVLVVGAGFALAGMVLMVMRGWASWVAILLWLVFLFSVGFLAGVVNAAIDSARSQARLGSDVPEIARLGVPLLRTRTYHVQDLVLTGGRAHRDASEPLTLVYLGDSDGELVLYDYWTDRSLRLPKEDVRRLCTSGPGYVHGVSGDALIDALTCP